jgi:hypothetical protein
MRKFGLFLLIVFVSGIKLFSQSGDSIRDVLNYRVQIINGDTTYIANLPPVYLYNIENPTDIKELKKYSKLVHNVRKVYPYAKLFAKEIKLIENELLKIKTKKERQAYIDSTEKRLRTRFEKDLVKMTVSQGRILIKLLYRETGNTSYEILKEMKGSFSAFFWQSVARLFGSTLKSTYDPLGEDKDIEAIVIQIETEK